MEYSHLICHANDKLNEWLLYEMQYSVKMGKQLAVLPKANPIIVGF